MNEDRIEQDVLIDASPESVWAVLTEPAHVGEWFGQGAPAEIDLRPGGIMQLDHGDHGKFPTTIVDVDPPRRFTYRWASGFPGEAANEANSTLVEFTLEPENGGTRLKVVESGFTTRLPAPVPSHDDSHAGHVKGWAGILPELKKRSEKLAV